MLCLVNGVGGCWWTEEGFGIECWWRDMVRRQGGWRLGAVVFLLGGEIAKIRDGVAGDDGGWFGERVSKVIGDGKSTFFWYDNWLGDVSLCRRFGRLFDLATNKLISVADIYVLGWEMGGEAWSWRKVL